MSQKASKILLFLLPICAVFTLQACFYGGGRRYYGNGYGYSPPPVYAASPPQVYAYRQPPPQPVYGDYDSHHVWHDRDWWVKNDRPWVEHHHPTWIAHNHDHHDRDHHDHDEQ